MKKKGLVIALSVMLVLCLAVGGTLAWLSDKTDEVKNTFTVGNIDITLDETTGETYKMVPGNTIEKDPFVTVEAGSEDCYLFVKIVKNDTYNQYLEDYAVKVGTDDWTLLEESGNTAVYYREVAASNVDQEFTVLDGNKVVVKGEGVTKSMMEAIDGIVVDAEGNVTTTTDATELAKRPTLTFTAYAVQKANFATAELAWAEANK